MDQPDYRALYEEEKRRREEVERKYDELRDRIRPLLDEIGATVASSQQLEEALGRLIQVPITDSGGDGHEV